ncbi:MAG TPA: hypothetical protein VMF66_18675 [Candidatus Acidoferrum sp.]|nr:hypothetical protein [Candidatus Acidoferrum sp.]
MLFGYLSAIVLAAAAAALNPLGLALMWESALPATAGAQSGLLWWQYYIPKKTAPALASRNVRRSYGWIGAAVVCAAVFILVLGRGVRL